MSSAFFIWLEYSGQSIERSTAQAMLGELDGYGGDAKELLLNDTLAIASQARWTTHEDVGEQQPLFNAAQTECFLFDGRIDNRQHLIDELANAGNQSQAELSDAALLYAFLVKFGDARLAEVIGPFVFVLFDLANGSVRCARDAMGGRYLVYLHTKERLIISSTELAFLRYPEIGHHLDESKVVGWLANHHDGASKACLKGLDTLAPGQKAQWQSPQEGPSNGKALLSTFYRPYPERRLRYNTDEQYAHEFRRLLDQAVRRRLRCRTAVGCMLSGGMDSVPIAISAVQEGGADSVLAYSWVFDDSPEMDERVYSSPICKQLGVPQKLIKCDRLWPQFNDDTHSNPLFPFALPYSEFQQETFRQARNEGVSVMLSGLQGDLLYETGNQQVLEALRRRRFKYAFAEFKHLRKSHNLSHWNAFKRYLIAPLPFLQKVIERRRLARPIIDSRLKPSILKLLRAKTHVLFADSAKAARSVQYRIVLDSFAGDDSALGRVMENKYQIERRYPFRDRELCEFMLAIPTDQLEKLGNKRPIVKRAYSTEFTPELMNRNDKTNFAQSLRTGILADSKWLTLLNQTPSYWQKFVKECDFSALEPMETTELVFFWRCAYYNFWHLVWYDLPDKSNEVGFGSVKSRVAK